MDVNVFGDGVVSVMSEQPSWNTILTEVVVSWSGVASPTTEGLI